MAKRFTDTNKYKKPFIRGLQGAYKLLWDYLYHDCDHAGIWIVDFDIAQIYIGKDMSVNKVDALKYFNTNEIRIVEFNSGSKWFIPSFIEFQYGILNEQNRAHNSVIKILSKYNLYQNKKLISPLQGAKEKDKEKELDKDKEKEENGNDENFKPNNSEIVFNTLPELQKELINSETWHIELAQIYNITTKEVVVKLNIFLKEQSADDDKFFLIRSLTEIKKHFRNTLKLNIVKEKGSLEKPTYKTGKPFPKGN